MSTETDALIELLVQLKKIVGTVPDQAKLLLTSQPSLAYSLIQLMIKMNILNAEALQKTLASMANSQPQPAQLPGLSHTPPVMPNGHSQPMPGSQQYPGQPHQYNGQAPPSPQTSVPYSNSVLTQTPPLLPPNAQAMLAAIPDDQKSMILQILSYTPEQINQLAPADRTTFIQLRATFGVDS